MKFIENNIIDKTIKDFDKKNRFLGAYIRLKIKIRLFFINLNKSKWKE